MYIYIYILFQFRYLPYFKSKASIEFRSIIRSGFAPKSSNILGFLNVGVTVMFCGFRYLGMVVFIRLLHSCKLPQPWILDGIYQERCCLCVLCGLQLPYGIVSIYPPARMQINPLRTIYISSRESPTTTPSNLPLASWVGGRSQVDERIVSNGLTPLAQLQQIFQIQESRNTKKNYHHIHLNLKDYVFVLIFFHCRSGFPCASPVSKHWCV